MFREEAALARDLGFDVCFVDAVPFMGRPGIRFDDQARFHPRKYLAGLAKAFCASGGKIYEHSAAAEFSKEPLGVAVNGRFVGADDIVIATHNPLAGNADDREATLLQTKLALYLHLRHRGPGAVGCGP